MQPAFWQESWDHEGYKTSFHRPDLHPYVAHYLPPERLAGRRVFVPLAGKTVDLAYFRDHAAHATGVELVEKPIHQFFHEQGLPYADDGEGRFQSSRLTFLNRDLFALDRDEVGPIDFVLDRASLIAFPLEMRLKYLRKMDELLPVGAQTLLITLEYEPYLDSPPFSVCPGNVAAYYGDNYEIELVESPLRPGHGMQRVFNLDFVREHGFLITKVRE